MTGDVGAGVGLFLRMVGLRTGTPVVVGRVIGARVVGCTAGRTVVCPTVRANDTSKINAE